MRRSWFHRFCLQQLDIAKDCGERVDEVSGYATNQFRELAIIGGLAAVQCLTSSLRFQAQADHVCGKFRDLLLSAVEAARGMIEKGQRPKSMIFVAEGEPQRRAAGEIE